MSNITNAAIAVQLLIDLTNQSLKIQQVMQKAQSEGRDITKEELDSCSVSTDAALNNLKSTIDSMGA